MAELCTPTLAGEEKSEGLEEAQEQGAAEITESTCHHAFSRQRATATGLLGAHLIATQLGMEK